MFLQLVDLLHRTYIGPLFPSYLSLPFRHRFEWDRRAVNILFQVFHGIFNVYIIIFDPSATADYIYGFSRVAHLGHAITIAFYLYETTGFVMHPFHSSKMLYWVLHHFIASALLLYNISYKQSSAFPASILMMSACAHLPNDMLWLFRANNFRNQTLANALHVASFGFTVSCCGFPPPYLLLKCASELRVSIKELVLLHMRPYCILTFLIFYLPHLKIICIVWRRLVRNWNKPMEPLVITKID